MASQSEGEMRVALIGYGLAGAAFHAPLIAATEGMRVAGVVTRDPERRARAQRDFPEAALLADAGEVWEAHNRYDLAVIAAPNRAHVPLGLAAIDAGLPVVVDKPVAPSAAAARRLLAASEEQGVPLTVFQNRRWDGDFLTVRSILDRGLLGRIVRYESRFERYRPVPKAGAWRESPDPEEGGGLLLDLGSHLIDQALVLFGRPSAVYAEIGVQRPGAQVDDDTFVALRFPDGLHAHLWMNTVVRILGPRFHVSGLRGSYSKYGLDPQEVALRGGARPGAPGWGAEPAEAWGMLSTPIGDLHVDGSIETLPGRYDAFYAGLRDALRSGAPLPVDPRDSLTALEVIEAARNSVREGTVIPFPPESEAAGGR